ncbi:helix-turn-helix domain-containing protein [Parasphaerochaeta coccoides]|uniref:Helix-turn-helix domain protein n=1 Tax=Parasphaerochaeta coccoides (strain ATCC BAA-1237 / DSM 17374 / SPN1) TaxID=760011 RepID=F4GIM9_PARC1|nr:helix-turn-helix transcriptional regulator [Parasphaerochaeta coccoides]AEC02163.1 helix-turn-helix domain protein [Parasphaerochaeta coccoides DSM 17374]
MGKIKSEFWQRVAVLLKKRRLKIADLARLSSVDQRAISSGIRLHTIPQSDTALAISDALGVSVRFLLYGIDDSGTDDELEQAIEYCRNSRQASQVLKLLQFLTPRQYAVLLDVFETWGLVIGETGEINLSGEKKRLP